MRDKLVSDPRLIQICVNCEKPICKWGTCVKYEQAEQELSKQIIAQGGRLSGQVYAYQGKIGNVEYWSEQTGLPVSTIRTRIRKGLSMKAVLAPLPGPVTGLYKGKRYTVRELAELAGVNVSTMRDRLGRFTVQEAVEMGRKRGKPKAMTVKNGARRKK